MYLGIHVGHDSNISVVDRSGRILGYSLLERLDGIRHSGGCFSVSNFQSFCEEFSINPNDITHAAITSGQHLELVFWEDSAFNFNYATNGVSPFIDEWAKSNITRLPQDKFLEKAILGGSSVGFLSKYFPQYVEALGTLRNSNTSHTSPSISSSVPYIVNNYDVISSLGYAYDDNEFSAGFILPGILDIKHINKSIPCFYVDHHFAHCSSAFAKSPFNNPFVFSSDGGGVGGNGNLACTVNPKNILSPLSTSNFAGGQFYSVCSQRIGLDPGKLMGLSAYHSFDQELHDFFLNYLSNQNPTGGIPEYFISLFENKYRCTLSPSDSSRISCGDDDNWKTGFNPVDSTLACYAATVQEIFMSWFALTIESLSFNLNDYDGLVLSGGAALNCPTNQFLASKYSDKVFVETSCNDEGLSFGAIAAASSLLGISSDLYQEFSRFHNRSPYQCHSPFITQSFPNNDLLTSLPLGEDWSEVASLLASGHIGFLCLGRAELGPRALGNRSIIALASNRSNHFNINRIKSRELWRPLAPIVLDEDFHHYFTGSQNPYMLMTNTVTTSELPAITHFDDSARVQVVGPEQSNFYKLLQTLKRNHKDITPVLVNTSLNGPREPIIDSIQRVVELLLTTSASFVVTRDHLILKRDI